MFMEMRLREVNMKIPINQIMQGDCLEHLKELPEKSINMCMTSPPYWALRDYGTARWEGGDKDCKHEVQNNIKDLEGDWDRPSRNEFNKVGTLLKCQVCKKEFKGKLGNKFCSTKCLNTLSNDERTKAKSEMVNICSECGAKRVDKQLGLEPTFDEYINKLCDIFDEVQRVLRDDGTCWVNIGDSYNNSSWANRETRLDKKLYSKIQGTHSGRGGQLNYPDKCLAMIPFRFAIEMVNRGWILRNTIIWHKRSCMPSSAKDRFTIDFEYIFFFSKNKKYYFEIQREPLAPISMKDRRKDKGRFEYDGKRKGVEGIQNVMCGINSGGRNKRTVWTINPKPFKEAHFAVYPEELCETPIKAGCSEGGIVLDPFFGAGTTGLVALKQDKKFIGIELNPEYIKIAQARLKPHLEQRKLI